MAAVFWFVFWNICFHVVTVVMVTLGTERRIVTVDSQLVKCRMSQTIGGETALINFSPIEGTHSCTVFGAALWRDASYLCIGFPDRITLMKYNPSLAMYCCRKVSGTNMVYCMSLVVWSINRQFYLHLLVGYGYHMKSLTLHYCIHFQSANPSA